MIAVYELNSDTCVSSGSLFLLYTSAGLSGIIL